MSKKFNGKKFAQEKLVRLEEKVHRLKITGVTPTLHILQIGDDKASDIYVNLKKATAEKIGIQVEVNYLPADINKNKVIELTSLLNKNKYIHGIMVQLPLPKKLNSPASKSQILNSISSSKDVDGLTKHSPFTAATAKAILDILESFTTGYQLLTTAVTGSDGTVGKSVIADLKKLKPKKIIKLDINDNLNKLKKADIIISTTGKANLIKANHVKKGFAAVDVGSPKPEFTKAALKKSKFHTPVPGGVGPVTIACLFENLVEAAEKSEI